MFTCEAGVEATWDEEVVGFGGIQYKISLYNINKT